jgi:hypothetical protein
MLSAALGHEAIHAERMPVHFVFHLSKCAGCTIHWHLATHLRKGSYYRPNKRKGFSRLFLPRYELTGMPEPQHLKAVGGHFLGRSIEHLFAGRPIKRSILLRDPVSHFVSHYNFRMMRYLSQGLGTYSPEIAYRARQPNFLTHFILRNFLEIPWPRILSLSAVEKYAAVNRFLSSFWFVGDYMRCNDLVAALAPELGVPATAKAQNTCAKWQGRVRWNLLRVDDLPRQTIEQIRRENMLDQLLWETWNDVGQACISTRVETIHEQPLTEFVARQALRLVFQVKRRVHRGWLAPGRGIQSSPLGLSPHAVRARDEAPWI